MRNNVSTALMYRAYNMRNPDGAVLMRALRLHNAARDGGICIKAGPGTPLRLAHYAGRRMGYSANVT